LRELFALVLQFKIMDFLSLEFCLLFEFLFLLLFLLTLYFLLFFGFILLLLEFLEVFLVSEKDGVGIGSLLLDSDDLPGRVHA
jgi:hypothetical protein